MRRSGRSHRVIVSVPHRAAAVLVAMRRLPLRLLGLAFAWMFLVGLVNAAVQQLPVPTPSSMLGGVLGLVQALAALVTGVRLLRARASALRALRAWMLASAVLFAWVVLGPVPGISPYHTAALAILAASLAWLLHRVVARSLAIP